MNDQNVIYLIRFIAGVMANTTEVAYLSAGMSGRPTRTFMKFLFELMKEEN